MPSPRIAKKTVIEVCAELKRITNFPMSDDHIDQVYHNLNAKPKEGEDA